MSHFGEKLKTDDINIICIYIRVQLHGLENNIIYIYDTYKIYFSTGFG